MCVCVYFYSKCDFVLSPRQSLLSRLPLGVGIFFFPFQTKAVRNQTLMGALAIFFVKKKKLLAS